VVIVGQRPRQPTEDERRAARQAASDELCDALGVERFDVGDELEIPGGSSPMTSPAWPRWYARATRALDVPRASAPPKARGVNYNPLEWARAQRRPTWH
jgi:hypothetical protein